MISCPWNMTDKIEQENPSSWKRDSIHAWLMSQGGKLYSLFPSITGILLVKCFKSPI